MPVKDFPVQVGNDYYDKSDNPDIVYQYKRQELYLRGASQSLENQIKSLSDAIEDLEKPLRAVGFSEEEVAQMKVEREEEKKRLIILRDRRQAMFDELEAM